MEIVRKVLGSILTLSLRGRLDGTWSESTSQALVATLEEGWHDLRLDLSGVDFVSSAGLRTLLLHQKRLAGLGGRMAVVTPSPEVERILDLAGLSALFAEVEAPALEATARSFPGGKATLLPRHAGAKLSARLLKSGEVIAPNAEGISLGLGALGTQGGSYGEFLALGGAAFAQPPGTRLVADYQLAEGRLMPEVTAYSGLAAEGRFAFCLRFESDDPHAGVPLSRLLEQALEAAGSEAVALAFAMETAHLVGAALIDAPEGEQLAIQPFPQVREQLLFTVEPAWPRSLSLGVAFAVRGRGHPLSAQLRPLHDLSVHTHAVAFPYRPLPKGELEPTALLSELLEREQPLGLLHLLHDDRPGGTGESCFTRGAIWASPLTTSP